MATATSPVLVGALRKWPTLAEPDVVSDSTRLRKLAYARVARASDAEEQERVSGAFAVLPVELVDVVCAKLLRIGFAHFFSFVCTCRAAYRVVSKRTAIEAMCMKNLFNQASLAHQVEAKADDAEQYPFTELAKTMIRSRVEQEVLRECVEGSVLHCADPTSECCRTQRTDLNACWRLHPTIAERFPTGTLGAEALRGRSVRNVSVAASSASCLLCATPNGAVLASDSRVWTVTSKPAAEFTPGYELESTFLMDRYQSSTEPIWAAAEGNRIAVCQRTHDTEYASFYVVKIFDDGRLVGEDEVEEEFSYQSPSHVVARAARNSVETMWLHKGEVWVAFVHENLSHTFSWVRLRAIQPDVHGNFLKGLCHTTLEMTQSFGRIDCSSVASDSGDLALIETLANESRIWCFDMKARTFGLVRLPTPMHEPHCILHVPYCLRHEVRLSPDGLTMVILDRSHCNYNFHVHRVSGPIRIYRRCGGDVEQRKQWRPVWVGGGSPHRPVSQVLRLSPLKEAVFTPCGRRFYAFFRATDRSPGGMLRLNTTFTNEVNDTFHHVPPYRLPSKVVWSKDGLFVHTSTVPVGVLRLGLVE